MGDSDTDLATRTTPSDFAAAAEIPLESRIFSDAFDPSIAIFFR